MPLDWDKPIQFINGDRCRLVETNAAGWTQWGARADGSYPTRCIVRLEVDPNEKNAEYVSHWYVYEDGRSGYEDFHIVNMPEFQ